MPIYGKDVDFGICFQNSFGTVADISNSAQTLPIVSQSITSKRPLITQQNMRGVYEEGDSYLGLQEVSGDIEMEAHPISIGYMFGAFFGVGTVVTSDNLYSHTWIGKTSPFDSSNASFKRPVTVSRAAFSGELNFYNLVANTLEFSLSNGELLKVKTSFVGGRDDDASVSFTEAYPGGVERFSWHVSSIDIDSITRLREVSELTITMEDPVEPQWYLNNTVWPGKNVLTGMRKCSLSATLHYDTNSVYEWYKDKDFFDFVITMEDKSIEVQSGYYNKLAVRLQRLRIETAEYNNGGPGETMLSITANAHYDANMGTPEMYQVTLVNTKSAY